RITKTRARIRIGTLNIKGYGSDIRNGVSGKWLLINQLMKENKLSVLAIQETHLTQDRANDLTRLFGPRLKFFVSNHPTSPSRAAGIAFVLNMELHGSDGATCREIVPGRAAALTMPWGKNRQISILNVYAPNDATENASFWTTLRDEYNANQTFRPDVVAGDFNMVESAADRYPHRHDPQRTVTALSEMKTAMKLVDTWRQSHPNDNLYTYLQLGTGSQSRLDRVYTTAKISPAVADWECTITGISTDHSLVSMSIARYNEPEVGRGRWAMPISLLDDPPFCDTLRKLGMDLQTKLDAISERSANENPQLEFARFKELIKSEARKRVACKTSKANAKICRAKQRLEAHMSRTDNPTQTDRETSEILRVQLKELEAKRFNHRRTANAAKDWTLGERIGKYWMKVN
ncbi:DNase I-like protein, partial [Trametes sanguinea]